MSLFDRVADLPLAVEDYDLEYREAETSSDFTRATTTVALRGDGETGSGEDVTYDTAEHEVLADDDPGWSLSGSYDSFEEFSAALDDVDPFPGGDPEREDFRHYRRWGVESAALDLALKQADTNLAAALGESYDPVRFVVSTRLGDPPTFDRVGAWLDVDPDLEFKLDATSDWTPELVDRLAATDAVRIVDLKGQYHGTEVDQTADPELYHLVTDEFSDAILEDPALTDETRPIFDGREERVSWDSPITGVESIESLPFEPDWLNIKPSRFGTVERLLDSVEHCRERDVRMYGGGQFELGVGRQHLHALASLFYPDAPNDVAPGGYNAPEPRAGLPESPLSPPESPRGLEW